jgi:hypothetical protein
MVACRISAAWRSRASPSTQRSQDGLATVGGVRDRWTKGSAGDLPPPVSRRESEPRRAQKPANLPTQRRQVVGRALSVDSWWSIGNGRARHRSRGFFRTQPWLQSARDMPHAAVNALVAVVVVVAGLLAVISLLTAGGQPVLPSGHVVPISIQPISHNLARGGGHLIWYRTGHLLVVDIQVDHLQPHAAVSALLVPQGSCGGALPGRSRLVGRVDANSGGIAAFNDELLGVSNLRFSDWSIWIRVGGDTPAAAACGAITLGNGALSAA